MTDNEILLVQALDTLRLATTITNPAARSILVDIALDLQGSAQLGFLGELRSQKDRCSHVPSTIHSPMCALVRAESEADHLTSDRRVALAGLPPRTGSGSVMPTTWYKCRTETRDRQLILSIGYGQWLVRVRLSPSAEKAGGN
jgi:hypothetical protein